MEKKLDAKFFQEDEEKVVSREIAILELQKFIFVFDKKKMKDHEIEDKYPNLLEAVEDGKLVFDEKTMKPKYTLYEPLTNSDNEVSISEIPQFRTRVRPDDLKEIMAGLEISKNTPEYIIRILAFITLQPKAIINKFEKQDYKVLEQLATVFQ